MVIALGVVSAASTFVGSFEAGAPVSHATFKVTALTPSPNSQVTESTTISATLQYAIDNFAEKPKTYTASLMFDNPMDAPGTSTSSSDYGCHGATQFLSVASGTVVLECKLNEVWAKFRHSRHLGVTFVITQMTRGSNSIGLARTESVHFDIKK